MKKKCLAVFMILAMVFAFTACGNGGDDGGSDAETINVTFYSPNTGNYASEAVKVMADELTEKSGGTMVGTVIEAGTAGTQDEAVQAMMSGDMQVIVNTVDQLENQMPGCGNWLSWPFLFDTEEQAEEAWDNGGWMFQTVQEQAAEGGVHVFKPIYSGFKTFAFNKKVESYDDWQGMKVRVPNTELFLDLCARYGMQTVSGMDPYTSLQNGTVDSVYFGEEGHQTFKLEEVMTYLVMTHDTYGSNLYTCSEEFYQSLTDDQKAILDDVINTVGDDYNKQSKDSITDYVAGLEDAGIKVIYPDTEWINEMKKDTVSFWEERLEDDKYSADLREKLREVYETNYADVI